MIKYSDILSAKKKIGSQVKNTNLIQIGNIYLKMENLHKDVNAFKIRGAYNKMLSLNKVKKVVTAAIGSHGFAVGTIGRKLKINTICFMPKSAPQNKKNKMRSLVDMVIIKGDRFNETEELAKKYAQDNNLTFIHPYNDEKVIAGQGTIALELIKQLKKINTIYCPVGGGGLISGISIVIKKINPKTKIIGVQPLKMHSMGKSYYNKKIVSMKEASTIANPLGINLNPKTITFNYILKNVDEFLYVSEEDIKLSIKKIYIETKNIVEGAGAIAYAAALNDSKRKGNSICIVSGGNASKNDLKTIFD
jgi:threonine dehydratase